MREPKTPLPWAPPTHRAIPSPVQKTAVLRADGLGIGFFAETDDRDYAVHAANVLPEVLAALREIAGMFQQGRGPNRDTAGLRGEAIVGDIYKIARAALAKAEGAGEGGAGG
jgi:hypothetical protein